MKMNKKGFTLIELLAVIVILAVIALIAVPQVLNILDKARKSAAADSAYGILKAAETAATTYMLDNNGDSMGAVDFACTTSGCTGTPSIEGATAITLDFKGTKPTAGTVSVDAKGVASIKVVDSKGLTINNFNCTQSGETVTCQ